MKRPVIILVVTVALLAAGACGSSSGSASSGSSSASGGATTPLRVILDWTPNTNHSGIYLARHSGWYRDAHLDVKVTEPGQDSTSVQQLAAGRADVVVSTEEDVTAARAKGLPVVSIAAVLQHNTSSLVALPAKSGIHGIGDLSGHTYGGYGGPLEEALVKKLTACGGGDPAKVKFVEVGDADYRVGMERGDFDFVWIFDGWDGIRYRQIDKLALTAIPFAAHRDCIPDWYTPVLATTEKMVKDHPDRLKAFMAATARGYRTAAAHPDDAANALLKSVPELDPALVRASARYLAPRYADDPKQWGRQDLAVWRKMTDFIAGSGMIDKPIDVPAAFTNRFLPSP